MLGGTAEPGGHSQAPLPCPAAAHSRSGAGSPGSLACMPGTVVSSSIQSFSPQKTVGPVEGAALPPPPQAYRELLTTRCPHSLPPHPGRGGHRPSLHTLSLVKVGRSRLPLVSLHGLGCLGPLPAWRTAQGACPSSCEQPPKCRPPRSSSPRAAISPRKGAVPGASVAVSLPPRVCRQGQGQAQGCASTQALTCALLAFSQLLHRPAEGLGQTRVTKEEAEVEGPARPRGSSLPRRGSLFRKSSSLGKLLKQLAFTKPFYFQIITPSREVSLSAERSRVHLAVSCNVCPSAMRGRRDQETLVVLSPLSRVRLPVGWGSHGYKHLPPASLGATCPIISHPDSC